MIANCRNCRAQGRPDPLSQLIQCFQRAATSEESEAASLANDRLFVNYARVMFKSIHVEEEDDGGDDDGEIDQAVRLRSIYVYIYFFCIVKRFLNRVTRCLYV